MTTRYTQEHYEDVARIIASHVRPALNPSTPAPYIQPRCLVDDFADLFAADNPPVMGRCCDPVPPNEFVAAECTNYIVVSGFNRDRFLSACGLDYEGAE
jgi:hypothetical protein